MSPSQLCEISELLNYILSWSTDIAKTKSKKNMYICNIYKK